MIRLQEEIAPFALENFRCQGNEIHLADCPVQDPAEPENGRESDYSFRDYNEDACDPFLGPFATVACGTSTSAGTPPRLLRPHGTHTLYCNMHGIHACAYMNDYRAGRHFEACAAGEGDMRLAQSVAAADGSAEYGRLEIFHEGGWGTVCDNAFINRFQRSLDLSDGAANGACRQLGYGEGFQIQLGIGMCRCRANVPVLAVLTSPRCCRHVYAITALSSLAADWTRQSPGS